MKRIQTYQKGDPEWVIIHKQYHELHDDERQALSEWISTPEEYAQMRQVLLELHDDQDEWTEPDASIKKHLMLKFAAEDKGGRMIWLNSVLFANGESWYKQPIVRYGLAAACMIGLGVFFLLPAKVNPHFADVQQIPTEQNASDELANTEQITPSASDTLQQFAEVRQDMPMPPSPIAFQTEISTMNTEEVNDADLGAYAESVAAPAMADDLEGRQENKATSDVVNDKLVQEPSRVATNATVPAVKKESVQTAIGSDGLALKNANSKMSVNMSEVNDLFSGLFTAR
jgi:hypothetical protein